MPLRIKLPAKERVLINGAVIESTAETATLVVHNRADILRRKEIMQDYEAITPARRVYYSLQNAYIFRDDRSRFILAAEDLMNQYNNAASSAAEIITNIRTKIAEENFYEALRMSRLLIEHERIRIEAFEKTEGTSPQDEVAPQ